MVDWARARREAIRKQAELRRRLTAAEQALDDAHAQVQLLPAMYQARQLSLCVSYLPLIRGGGD
jgi:hypothetical protein